jgi:putative flippase GtrA
VRGRLGRFEAICVGGPRLAVLSLHGLHAGLGLNLHLANLLAIGLATAWNFGLNARFTWRRAPRPGGPPG